MSLLFSQFASRSSSRDIASNFNSHCSNFYHLGFNKISKSTLCESMKSRPVEVFEGVFNSLLSKVQSGFAKDAGALIRLIDSTTIPLNLHDFAWAKFKSRKSGVKMHTVFDPKQEIPTYFEITNANKNDMKASENIPIEQGVTYVVDRAYNDGKWWHDLNQNGCVFVSRFKKKTKYVNIESFKTEDERVIADQKIVLTGAGKKKCPIFLRRITFIRQKDGKELVFITNDFERSATEIADLYKMRRQIELFFKWIKQNLKIKKFIGTTENAVKIQLIVAMIAYLLMRLVKERLIGAISLQDLIRLVQTNLMHRKSFFDLLRKPEHKPPVTQCHKQLQLAINFPGQ